MKQALGDDLKVPDLANICRHEVSHGVVALELDFNDFSQVFVDLVTPGITRRGGLDIHIDGLRDRFDTAVPIDQRRALAAQIIAIYAAGREGERLFGEPDKEWSSWDEEQIAWIGLCGVYTDEDIDLLNKNPARKRLGQMESRGRSRG